MLWDPRRRISTTFATRPLAKIGARLAPLWPSVPLPEGLTWINYISCAERDQLEQLAYSATLQGRKLTDAERVRFLSAEAAALARMADGWPS
ncbi:MAG: hypothetical protein K0S35_2273 [Geminicoccaceae bacterium]|jgi:hypothetical protein|nr:hypothetical protein [Geminicoccaceae bacterium]